MKSDPWQPPGWSDLKSDQAGSGRAIARLDHVPGAGKMVPRTSQDSGKSSRYWESSQYGVVAMIISDIRNSTYPHGWITATVTVIVTDADPRGADHFILDHE